MRLIDSDVLRKKIRDEVIMPAWCKTLVYCVINDTPTVNGVEVVRCKDCKYSCNPIPEDVGFVECLYCSDPRREPGEEMAIVGYNDFCSYGERKEE